MEDFYKINPGKNHEKKREKKSWKIFTEEIWEKITKKKKNHGKYLRKNSGKNHGMKEIWKNNRDINMADFYGKNREIEM